MDPNQQPNNIPSIKQPGNWSPMMDFTNDVQPKKPSFFAKYKKLIIISLVAVFLLIGLAVMSALSSSGDGAQTNLAGATTNVQLKELDNPKFTMSYPAVANVLVNEEASGKDGAFVMLSEEGETSAYEITISITNDDPFYTDSAEGLIEQQDLSVEPIGIITTDIVVAGSEAQKSIGEINIDGKELYVAFTSVKQGEKYILISAKYPKNNTDFKDSFDAMVGSIKLK